MGRVGRSPKPFCDGTHKTNGFIADEIILHWSDEP
jgi:CDGSH-type Zn-finger protein